MYEVVLYELGVLCHVASWPAGSGAVRVVAGGAT